MAVCFGCGKDVEDRMTCGWCEFASCEPCMDRHECAELPTNKIARQLAVIRKRLADQPTAATAALAARLMEALEVAVEAAAEYMPDDVVDIGLGKAAQILVAFNLEASPRRAKGR